MAAHVHSPANGRAPRISPRYCDAEVYGAGDVQAMDCVELYGFDHPQSSDGMCYPLFADGLPRGKAWGVQGAAGGVGVGN